jgi:hypothetical protein
LSDVDRRRCRKLLPPPPERGSTDIVAHPVAFNLKNQMDRRIFGKQRSKGNGNQQNRMMAIAGVDGPVSLVFLGHGL